jgi:PEP-CTERM motif
MLRHITLFLFLTAQAVSGLTVVGFSSSGNNRFASGYPSAPAVNGSGSFIGSGMDFSGVGWDSGLSSRSGTMISDEYFIFASHYQPGSTITFLSPTLLAANPSNPAAALVSYTVGTRAQMTSPITGQPSDFSIGRLTTALNPAHGIASYAILELDNLASYIGLEVLLYGNGAGGPRIGTNTIEDFFHYDLNGDLVDETFAAGYDFDSGTANQANFEGGDSGSPTFAWFQGRLTLIGTHSAITTISGQPWSFDNFAPVYLDQMQAQGIEFTAVPEPSRVLLLALGLMGMLRRRVRR